MKRITLLIILSSILLLITYTQNYNSSNVGSSVFGQKKRSSDMNVNYCRSSWYNILIQHPDQKYANEIQTVYFAKPQSDKFNDHSLDVKAVAADGESYTAIKHVNKFLNIMNKVAKRLVAKWFDRDKTNGYCDMNLIFMRGMENASASDIEISELSKRNKSILEDAGTELISNTFVLVHDIIYIEKGVRNEKIVKNISSGGKIIGSLLNIIGEYTDDDTYNNIGNAINTTPQVTAIIVNSYEDFRVKIKTHLYRLKWNNEDNDIFYDNYYLDKSYYDKNKFASWGNANYELDYIGSEEVVCGKTVMRELYDPADIIKKTVYRIMDECVVKLQQNSEEFKIKEPIYKIDDTGKVIVKIGLKESISKNSKYDVLERIDKGDGNNNYRRVGMIEPIANKIWNNRYMAAEEGAINAELEGTFFNVISCNNLYTRDY